MRVLCELKQQLAVIHAVTTSMGQKITITLEEGLE
jgi:hypothetical protein